MTAGFPGPPTPASDDRVAGGLRSQMFEAQKARRPPSRAVLEQVAAIYRKHIDGSPATAVQAHLNCSLSTANRRIKQAEQAGLLPRDHARQEARDS